MQQSKSNAPGRVTHTMVQIKRCVLNRMNQHNLDLQREVDDLRSVNLQGSTTIVELKKQRKFWKMRSGMYLSSWIANRNSTFIAIPLYVFSS